MNRNQLKNQIHNYNPHCETENNSQFKKNLATSNNSKKVKEKKRSYVERL